MKESALISIIMPAYNAAEFISEAIDSVLTQDYPHWELLIINDGSKDHTARVIEKYSDPRIRTFHTENRGVSKARNTGLAAMHGDYFTFLDADDLLTKDSLSVRMKLFEVHPEISFVEGGIEIVESKSGRVLSKHFPNYQGPPRSELIALSGRCFVSVGWMIKRDAHKVYQFPENMSHAEDLVFFISISEKGLYRSCAEVVMQVRRFGKSAMSNLHALEKGYAQLIDYSKTLVNIRQSELIAMADKIRVIMFKSYLRRGYFWRAILVFFRGVKA